MDFFKNFVAWLRTDPKRPTDMNRYEVPPSERRRWNFQ